MKEKMEQTEEIIFLLAVANVNKKSAIQQTMKGDIQVILGNMYAHTL